MAALAAVLAGGAAVEAAAQGVEEDRAALVALYRATNGASWVDSSNWATTAPLGEWFGVQTDDDDGRVTELSLSDNGLTGPIPPVLGDLGQLVALDLGQNDLTGPIPASVGNLGLLRGLYLHEN